MSSVGSPVFLITGASSGIGAAIAQTIATHSPSARLVLTGRHSQRLQNVASSLATLHTQPLLLTGSVTMPATAQQWVSQTLQTFGQLDCLINNAGVCGPIALAQEVPTDEIDRVIDTNLKGPLYLMQQALSQAMITQQSGTIININSIAGQTAFPYWAVYDASKFGLRALTEAIADEQRSNHIRVTGIYPAAVDTPLWQTVDPHHVPDSAGMLTAQQVADAVWYIWQQPAHCHIKELVLSALNPSV
ncbi:MAG: SDR family oxidoreductase [Vampirovibrionales bacterium]